MRLELITAPTEEPLTLVEAKLHLKETATAQDALITRLIVAARKHVEAATRRKLITQQWRIYFDNFPGVCYADGWRRTDGRYGAHFVLSDVAPVSAVDAVEYLDADGAPQTVATSVYQLVKEAPARLVLAHNQVWPSARGDAESVQVEVTNGYGGAAAVPEDIKAAMLLVIGHLFDHRAENIEGTLTQMPFAASSLISPYIVTEF